MSWFGSIGLAYKYAIIFVILLVATILAGLVKVLYDRKRIKKAAAKESLEAGQKEDLVELNQREKDEGDLFGIRAIEAGFYAGIPQSRPTSRAESRAETPSISANTLIGSFASPKIQTHSVNSSVTTLPLAHTRDSENLGKDTVRRKSPPTIKLRPSEAELSGRINHNAAVNMNLTVPPSPVLARGPSSPTFGSSDDDSSDGSTSPRSLSPHSANFPHGHYSPVPPQIPMPEGLRPSVHSPEPVSKSQSASLLNDHSPGQSPGNSAPPSPGLPPSTKLPDVPSKAAREEPRSLFPAYSDRRPSLPRVEVRQIDEQPKTRVPERPSSPVRLQPQTYQPSHSRDESLASSVYSNRMSTYQHRHKRSDSTGSSYNYSFPEYSTRNSVAASTSHSNASGSLQLPDSGDKTNDPRFSEFYDAYYRHSHLPQARTTTKRPNELHAPQETIVEVDSPLPSPNPRQSHQPGFAL